MDRSATDSSSSREAAPERNSGAFEDGYSARLLGCPVSEAPSAEAVGQWCRASWIAGWSDADRAALSEGEASLAAARQTSAAAAAEAPLIAAYNPNSAWGQHHVEIILKQWAYEARFVQTVGGNCIGLEVLESAVGGLYERLDGVPAEVTLTAPDGTTLVCVDEEDEGDDWLKRMCISLRIIAYIPPTVNEVRRINGAAPLPDGDRPVG